MTGVGSDTFQLQLRRSRDDTDADLTLSTTASQLSVSVGGSSTTLTINAAQSALDDLEGDYIADIVSKNGATLSHRAHGYAFLFHTGTRSYPSWSKVFTRAAKSIRWSGSSI